MRVVNFLNVGSEDFRYFATKTLKMYQPIINARDIFLVLNHRLIAELLVLSC